MEWQDIGEYESIRVSGKTHGGRYGALPGMVQPSGKQRLVLGCRGPYVAFRLLPECIEFPASCVSSAVPKAAPAAAIRKRTKAPPSDE